MPTPRPARIRPATPLDAAAVATLTARDPVGWERRLAEPGASTTWVADRDGAVVGVAVATAAGPGGLRSLEVEAFHVAAGEADDTGEHLLELAVGDMPCVVWVAETDRDAQELLVRHGFARHDGRRAGEAAVVGPSVGEPSMVAMVR